MLNTEMDIVNAIEEAKLLPHSMICSVSEVYLGETVIPDSLDEILWARFFGENCEIRLFRDGHKLKAAKISEGGCDFYDRYYKNDNCDKFGAGIKVRYLIGYDEDGQAYVAATRLCGTEE